MVNLTLSVCHFPSLSEVYIVMDGGVGKSCTAQKHGKMFACFLQSMYTDLSTCKILGEITLFLFFFFVLILNLYFNCPTQIYFCVNYTASPGILIVPCILANSSGPQINVWNVHVKESLLFQYQLFMYNCKFKNIQAPLCRYHPQLKGSECCVHQSQWQGQKPNCASNG